MSNCRPPPISSAHESPQPSKVSLPVGPHSGPSSTTMNLSTTNWKPKGVGILNEGAPGHLQRMFAASAGPECAFATRSAQTTMASAFGNGAFTKAPASSSTSMPVHTQEQQYRNDNFFTSANVPAAYQYRQRQCMDEKERGSDTYSSSRDGGNRDADEKRNGRSNDFFSFSPYQSPISAQAPHTPVFSAANQAANKDPHAQPSQLFSSLRTKRTSSTAAGTGVGTADEAAVTAPSAPYDHSLSDLSEPAEVEFFIAPADEDNEEHQAASPQVIAEIDDNDTVCENNRSNTCPSSSVQQCQPYTVRTTLMRPRASSSAQAVQPVLTHTTTTTTSTQSSHSNGSKSRGPSVPSFFSSQSPLHFTPAEESELLRKSLDSEQGKSEPDSSPDSNHSSSYCSHRNIDDGEEGAAVAAEAEGTPSGAGRSRDHSRHHLRTTSTSSSLLVSGSRQGSLYLSEEDPVHQPSNGNKHQRPHHHHHHSTNDSRSSSSQSPTRSNVHGVLPNAAARHTRQRREDATATEARGHANTREARRGVSKAGDDDLFLEVDDDIEVTAGLGGLATESATPSSRPSGRVSVVAPTMTSTPSPAATRSHTPSLLVKSGTAASSALNNQLSSNGLPPPQQSPRSVSNDSFNGRASAETRPQVRRKSDAKTIVVGTASAVASRFNSPLNTIEPSAVAAAAASESDKDDEEVFSFYALKQKVDRPGAENIAMTSATTGPANTTGSSGSSSSSQTCQQNGGATSSPQDDFLVVDYLCSDGKFDEDEQLEVGFEDIEAERSSLKRDGMGGVLGQTASTAATTSHPGNNDHVQGLPLLHVQSQQPVEPPHYSFGRGGNGRTHAHARPGSGAVVVGRGAVVGGAFTTRRFRFSSPPSPSAGLRCKEDPEAAAAAAVGGNPNNALTTTTSAQPFFTPVTASASESTQDGSTTSSSGGSQIYYRSFQNTSVMKVGAAAVPTGQPPQHVSAGPGNESSSNNKFALPAMHTADTALAQPLPQAVTTAATTFFSVIPTTTPSHHFSGDAPTGTAAAATVGPALRPRTFAPSTSAHGVGAAKMGGDNGANTLSSVHRHFSSPPQAVTYAKGESAATVTEEAAAPADTVSAGGSSDERPLGVVSPSHRHHITTRSASTNAAADSAVATVKEEVAPAAPPSVASNSSNSHFSGESVSLDYSPFVSRHNNSSNGSADTQAPADPSTQAHHEAQDHASTATADTPKHSDDLQSKESDLHDAPTCQHEPRDAAGASAEPVIMSKRPSQEPPAVPPLPPTKCNGAATTAGGVTVTSNETNGMTTGNNSYGSFTTMSTVGSNIDANRLFAAGLEPIQSLRHNCTTAPPPHPPACAALSHSGDGSGEASEDSYGEKGHAHEKTSLLAAGSDHMGNDCSESATPSVLDDPHNQTNFFMRALPEYMRRLPRGKLMRGPGFSMTAWTALVGRMKQLLRHHTGNDGRGAVAAVGHQAYSPSNPPPPLTLGGPLVRLNASEIKARTEYNQLYGAASRDNKAGGNGDAATEDGTRECLMVIRKIVYDVYPFLAYHPGGAQVMLDCEGKEATAVYDCFHPWINCESMLGPFAVGILEHEESP